MSWLKEVGCSDIRVCEHSIPTRKVGAPRTLSALEPVETVLAVLALVTLDTDTSVVTGRTLTTHGTTVTLSAINAVGAWRATQAVNAVVARDATLTVVTGGALDAFETLVASCTVGTGSTWGTGVTHLTTVTLWHFWLAKPVPEKVVIEINKLVDVDAHSPGAVVRHLLDFGFADGCFCANNHHGPHNLLQLR